MMSTSMVLTVILFICISFYGVSGDTTLSLRNSPKRTLLQGCPNSCNNNGACKDSVCSCISGLGGIDCSKICTIQCNFEVQKCIDMNDYSTNPGGGPTWDCLCIDGYYMTVSGNCTDINYCLNNTCDTQATCLSNPPEYTCTCNPGFQGDGTMGNCHDINECTSDTHNCNKYAACNNLVPGYTCHCIIPWKGDGFTCSLTGGGNTSAIYSPSTMIQPQFLCYTQNTTSWHAYLAYHSLLLYDQAIPTTNKNNMISTFNPQAYPGQTINFISGRHVAFMVTNPLASAGNFVKWTLDGNYLGVFTTSDDWSSYRCPMDITINIPINIKCPANIQSLQSAITTSLMTFLSSIKSSKGIMTTGESGQVVVTLPSTCTTTPPLVLYAEGLVTVTVSSSPSVVGNPTSGANAMDLVFDTVVDGSIVDILDSTSAQVVPKVLADIATIDTSTFNMEVGTPVTSPAPPTQGSTSINFFGKETSWFTFVMVIVPVILVIIIIVVVIIVGIVSKKKRDKNSIV